VFQKCFKKDDRLNGGYLVKRALYLSMVGSRLEGSDLVSGNVEWCLKSGDPSKPFLTFTPQGRMEKYAKVTVHAIPQKGAFKPSHLLPQISNLQPHSQQGSYLYITRIFFFFFILLNICFNQNILQRTFSDQPHRALHVFCICVKC
jgi:hypothetical protein